MLSLAVRLAARSVRMIHQVTECRLNEDIKCSCGARNDGMFCFSLVLLYAAHKITYGLSPRWNPVFVATRYGKLLVSIATRYSRLPISVSHGLPHPWNPVSVTARLGS